MSKKKKKLAEKELQAKILKQSTYLAVAIDIYGLLELLNKLIK